MVIKIFLSFFILSLTFENCYKDCKECIEYSDDEQNIKCTSCKDNFYLYFGTNNCIDKNKYPSYFSYGKYLIPCSYFNERCYECDPTPFFNEDFSKDICISCNP